MASVFNLAFRNVVSNFCAVALRLYEESHYLSTYEVDFFQVQHDALRFGSDKRLQLLQIFGLNPADQDKYNGLYACESLNP